MEVISLKIIFTLLHPLLFPLTCDYIFVQGRFWLKLTERHKTPSAPQTMTMSLLLSVLARDGAGGEEDRYIHTAAAELWYSSSATSWQKEGQKEEIMCPMQLSGTLPITMAKTHSS